MNEYFKQAELALAAYAKNLTVGVPNQPELERAGITVTVY